MKSPRPDSPIPGLPTIRTIRVESARTRDDEDNEPLSLPLRHHSAAVERSGSVLLSGFPPLSASSSPRSYNDPGSFPIPHRISLKPIVHHNQPFPGNRHSFQPTALPPFKNDVLTRGPHPTNNDERQTSLSSSLSSSPSDGDGEEEDMEIDTISAKVSDSQEEEPPPAKGTASILFVRSSEVPVRVNATSEPTRMQGWKCEKNFERDNNSSDMKVWPQVLVSVVVALAHLALGTVLAYPAISLPLLMTSPPGDSASLSQSDDADTSPFDQSYNSSNYDFLPVTEAFQDEDSDLQRTPESDSFKSSPFSHSEAENMTGEGDNDTGDATSQWSGFFPVIRILPEQAAWLASIHTVGAIFGSMICGTLLGVFGQRRTILLMAPIVLTSWITIWAAPSLVFLMAARMTAGVCIGVLGTGAQVYIVEISHESIRGSLTTITDLYVGIGLLLTYGLGALGLGWRWAAFIIGFTTIVPLMIGLSFFPDSPRWLAMKGRKEDARRALQFLRGHECDISNEFETIQKVCSNRTHVTTMEQMSMLKKPAVYTPFLTSCGVFTFSQFSGPYVVYSYTVYIFEVANVGFSPYLSTVIVGVARLIGSFIGIVVVEKAGRRIPLMVGGTGLSLSLMVLGTYFSLKSSDPEGASSLGWLPLTSMIVYTVTLGATISPIPFLLSTELQPLSFRSMGSSASKGVFFVSGMLVTYSFPTLKSSLGPALTFWLYSASALVLVVLVGAVVPETKGRTLEEIEEYYNRNASK
ncbi:facilitated trehalose transporter Tret1-2 homolog [Macrobrachium nipponense]|uniref:facilitated trehalose transporter Tret1-2 homolog n=1 Tax=Macrobrachium nipponense TaxID=159736 RepID=UPI0030C88136